MTFLDTLHKLRAREPRNPVDIELPLELPAGSQPLWQMSSFELMNGLDVTDFADTLDQRTFDELFPSGSTA